MDAGFLPDDIVVNILARLSAKPLLWFRCLSKYWCMLIDPYFMKLRSYKNKNIILPFVMDAAFLPDDIVFNIIAKLPTKSLLRFRCVSKSWRSMLVDPYFMKLRSHKNIILPLGKTLHFIDGNVPTHDDTYSTFKCSSPPEQLGVKETSTQVIGSLNGLVVLVNENGFVLYNPFTGKSKNLPVPPAPNSWDSGYGFGYGATLNDLKIVRFRQFLSGICDVYDFKSDAWSSLNTNIYKVRWYTYPVGTFVNGCLYWVKRDNKLIVVSVNDMVFSEVIVPCTNYIKYLGTINGCLCLVKEITLSRLELWVMKEHCNESTWENTHSFKFDFRDFWDFHILKILDDGRILLVNKILLEKNYSNQLIIYDVSKSSYQPLMISLPEYYSLHCVEYVETLVSPLDVLDIGREKEEIKDDKGKNLQMQCFT